MDGLYPGCADPISTVIVVSSPSIDLSDAESASILIRLPDDSVLEFEAEISDLSATGCTLTRVHEVDDIPEGSEGSARVWGSIDLGGTAPLITSSHAVSILQVGR